MKKNKGKHLFLLIMFMTVYFFCYSQDSTRIVPVQAWRLSRLIDATILQIQCDTALQKLYIAYDDKIKIIEVQNQIIDELGVSRETWKWRSLAQDTLLIKSKEIQKKELKDEKMMSNKKVVIGLLIGVLIGLTLF